MSIHKMTLKQYQAFTEARNAKLIESFPEPKGVRVFSTNNGTVVTVDRGHDGVMVIGDGVGVYWGEEAPEYLR